MKSKLDEINEQAALKAATKAKPDPKSADIKGHVASQLGVAAEDVVSVASRDGGITAVISDGRKVILGSAGVTVLKGPGYVSEDAEAVEPGETVEVAPPAPIAEEEPETLAKLDEHAPSEDDGAKAAAPAPALKPAPKPAPKPARTTRRKGIRAKTE